MITDQLSGRIAEYAKAQRVARTLQAQGQPIPPQVTNLLASGEALFAVLPPHVQKSVQVELVNTHAKLEAAITQERWASAQREAAHRTTVENDTFKKASGGRWDAETTRKIAKGEATIAVTHTTRDKRGEIVKKTEQRKPTDGEHRTAALLMAAKQHGMTDRMADQHNGRSLAELREREESKYRPKAPDDRRLDLINAFDAVEAVSEPDTGYTGDSGSDLKDSLSQSWDANAPAESTQEV